MKRFSILFSITLGLALISTNAAADFLGLYVGGGVWKHDPSGAFGSTQAGSTAIDLEQNLNFSDESEGYLWAAFEHPIPMVPNVRLDITTLGHEGASGTVNFNGFPVSGSSKISLDSVDATLYYRLLDNWVNVDVGLTLRSLDGEFSVGSETLSVSETVPMLYAAAQFDMPFTGLSLGGDLKLISYDGNDYSDLRLRALYELGVFGFEAGVRTTTIELDAVDGVNSDIEFTGIMLGAFLHF